MMDSDIPKVMDPDHLLSLLPERVDLPRGRSALSEAEVSQSRNARIQQAVIDEVAASGFHKATVAAITKRARISRTSFYQEFVDKEDAFAAAHRTASDLALALVWGPVLTQAEGDLEARVRIALETYVAAIESNPAFGYCFFIEIRRAGEQLLKERDEMLDRHARILSDLVAVGAKSDPNLIDPGADQLVGVLGALDELMARELRAQAGAESLNLGGVIDPFIQVLLAVARGPRSDAGVERFG